MKHLVIITALLAVTLPSARVVVATQESEGWDFVPGEKLLLYDDYTDMPKGAAPVHWKVRGGALRLVNGRLTASPGEEIRMFPNITKWPKNFTIEMDISGKGVEDPGAQRVIEWTFESGGNWVWYARLAVSSEGGCSLGVEIATPGESQNAPCKALPDQPNKYGIWIQDGRIRFYLNGQRLMDWNQVKVDFGTAVLRLDNGPLPLSLGPFRIAESSPDVSKALFSTGRYITHGIQFDVNSDVIRGESRPVLQQIAEALATQPAVKLRIEGHTDSTGDPAKNLDLSKRRAASVKNTLVKEFGIAADRLTTDGFGDTKPAAGNDTPRGRAENRRVEFVKL